MQVLYEFCRCPDPGVRIPTSKCRVFPRPRWWCKRQHSNARFILVPAAGPYVQQRGCARVLYYLAPRVLVVGVQAMRERKGSSQVSARSGVGWDECSVVPERPLGREKPESQRPTRPERPAPAQGSPPPPFIVIRRGGIHEWEHGSRRFPLNRGGTVVGHGGKYTVGRRRASQSC